MTANWDWPQWTIALIMLFNVIGTAALHGKPRSGNHNGVLGIVSFGFSAFVLTAGGFFR